MPTNKRLVVVAALVLLWSAAAVAQPAAPHNSTPEQRATAEDGTLGAVSWFEFAAGSVGLTAGQTLRLSIVNLSASTARVQCGLWQNPQPVSLEKEAPRCQPHETHRLRPGEAWECDLTGSDVPAAIFDKAGRAQIRAVVLSSSHAVAANVELFDTKTGRTRAITQLREMARE